jgi:deoxyhypusine synthase
MIPGGMRQVICDMIRMKLVDVIVSTGANIFHDLFESFGYRHYVGSEGRDDDALRRHRIVRVYDALMDDHEINRVIHLLSKAPKGFWNSDIRIKDSYGAAIDSAQVCG